MPESATRSILWLATLALGIHAGAAVYEMLVVTPLWAGDPPQSVRGFNAVAGFAIEPLSYKLPAMAVLGFVSFAALSVGVGISAGRIWALTAGMLGLALVAATFLHAIPILQRTIGTSGEGLTDAQIVEDVRAWITWSRVRIALLIVAWLAAVTALVQRYASSRRFFHSDLR